MGSQGTKLAVIESRDQVYDYDHDIASMIAAPTAIATN